MYGYMGSYIDYPWSDDGHSQSNSTYMDSIESEKKSMQNILGKCAGIPLGEKASIVGICCLFLYFIKAGQTMSEWNKEKDGQGKYKAGLLRSLSSTQIKNIVVCLNKRFIDTYLHNHTQHVHYSSTEL